MKSKALILIILTTTLVLLTPACKKPIINHNFNRNSNTNQSVNQVINPNVSMNTNTYQDVEVIGGDIDHKDSVLLILEELKKIYPEWLSNYEVNKTKLYWRRDDGSRMALYSAFALSESLKNKSIKEIEAIPLEQDLLTPSQQEDLKKFFKNRGFLINNQNSGEELIYGDVIDYRLSFEKAEKKCMIYWNNIPSLPSSTLIACSVYTKEDEAIYNEFSSLFNDPDSFWSIEKFEDNFAIGNYSPGRSGYEWFAKKIDGNWIIIQKTQEGPNCSILKEYNVPDTFYHGECWEDDGRSRRTWTNQ